MSFRIREAVKEDYIKLNELVLEVHKLHVQNRPDVYRDTETPLEEEQFNEMLDKQEIKIFVVEEVESRELVAYSEIENIGPRSIKILISNKMTIIEAFCVRKNHRKKGIGRLLFDYIVEDAKKSGSSLVQLVVWDFNKEAIKFYENLGMTNRNIRMELKI